jgi:apolipoprotein N-acyltransferase
VALAAGSAAVSRRRRPPVSNVAVFIRPGEAPRFYEKNVPLLFGERVPGFDLLPASWREKLAQVGNIALGTENPLLHLPRGPAFRNLLCYEAVIPSYARASSRGADFLVNLTEDMWYGNTAQIPQHASVLVLRAVENRATILRTGSVRSDGAGPELADHLRAGGVPFPPRGSRGRGPPLRTQALSGAALRGSGRGPGLLVSH